METKFGAAQAPFGTDDGILAYCLYLAGIPFFDSHQPCINVYDKDILDKLGLTEQGMSLEDAVREALRRKKKGHVEYGFKMSTRLNLMIKTYRRQLKLNEDSSLTAAAMVSEIVGTEVSAEMLMRLACVMMKMRVAFMNVWLEMQPMIRVKNQGRARKLASGATRHPGFRMVSLNASAETRKKLKL